MNMNTWNATYAIMVNGYPNGEKMQLSVVGNDFDCAQKAAAEVKMVNGYEVAMTGLTLIGSVTYANEHTTEEE